MKPHVEKPTEPQAGYIYFKNPCLGILLVKQTKKKKIKSKVKFLKASKEKRHYFPKNYRLTVDIL